ncbi:MFS superfamily sulfate permease-like transporter [Flavobacterium croceum DSM 17960]|uniref:MFS superfamily sulfate permease-like transporter n=1 Tax=Flavobacterium croceum DSM 17960 TaxID=1121886 RepID=A0A2S4N7L3_9FLAO|nr:SulP family inorganic anion transporter [Flavobacterium croceum]POS01699.1 MFS superfamily sulfate permease-like transporter [Flavobacterium croceum DSM 17960]
MNRKLKYYELVWIKHDLPAGLTVFLVALPLCLGISLASGAPLYSGLMSGIIGGLFVSVLSGSQLGVSGPAAGLTTLVSASILSLGNFQTFLLAVIIAGLFQLLLGILKMGLIANYFPSAVIKGMLASIGIILISKQIPIAIGYDKPDFWTNGFLNLFSNNDVFGNFISLNKHISRATIIISLLSIAILISYSQSWTKKIRLIPAPLLVVILGIVATYIFQYYDALNSLKPTQLVKIPENIFGNIVFPNFNLFLSNSQIWKDGILIGLLASLETLLCVEAVDKLDKRNRITPVNRELIAQGIGNMLCGFLGAIPMTAVVVRGAANVEAGARTKLASFTHGLFLLLAVLFIPILLNKIPYASLSAILIITGFNLAKPRLFRSMWLLGWKQFFPFIITIIFILATDLLIGVLIGLLIALYFIIQNNFQADYKVIQSKQHETEVYYIKLHDNVTFLNKVKFRTVLDKIPEYSILTIDGNHCKFIDHDILEVISEYGVKAHYKHIELRLLGINLVPHATLH